MATSKLLFYETKQSNVFRVDIVLMMETKHIGKFDLIKQEFTSTPRTKDKHLHRSYNALGFNIELLELNKLHLLTIPYNDGITTYLMQTTKAFIKRFGIKHQFYKAGYEKQIFLPLDKFGLERALELENELINQKQLFN